MRKNKIHKDSKKGGKREKEKKTIRKASMKWRNRKENRKKVKCYAFLKESACGVCPSVLLAW